MWNSDIYSIISRVKFFVIRKRKLPNPPGKIHVFFQSLFRFMMDQNSEQQDREVRVVQSCALKSDFETNASSLITLCGTCSNVISTSYPLLFHSSGSPAIYSYYRRDVSTCGAWRGCGAVFSSCAAAGVAPWFALEPEQEGGRMLLLDHRGLMLYGCPMSASDLTEQCVERAGEIPTSQTAAISCEGQKTCIRNCIKSLNLPNIFVLHEL